VSIAVSAAATWRVKKEECVAVCVTAYVAVCVDVSIAVSAAIFCSRRWGDAQMPMTRVSMTQMPMTQMSMTQMCMAISAVYD